MIDKLHLHGHRERLQSAGRGNVGAARLSRPRRMIVGQNECRRAALERPLEQHPIGNAVRMLGAAPDQLVAQECASPIEMDEEKDLLLECTQMRADPIVDRPFERKQEVARAYQPIQAASLPCARKRRR